MLGALSRKLAAENAARRNDYELARAGAAENYFGRRGGERIGAAGQTTGFMNASSFAFPNSQWGRPLTTAQREEWTWNPPGADNSPQAGIGLAWRPPKTSFWERLRQKRTAPATV